MKLEITIPDYDKSHGLKLNWEDGFTISSYKTDTEIIIKANREGLLSLANHLLNLSQHKVPIGAHIHLDDINSLEDGSVDVIFEKMI